jgi:hypothetical protein
LILNWHFGKTVVPVPLSGTALVKDGVYVLPESLGTRLQSGLAAGDVVAFERCPDSRVQDLRETIYQLADGKSAVSRSSDTPVRYIERKLDKRPVNRADRRAKGDAKYRIRGRGMSIQRSAIWRAVDLSADQARSNCPES